MGVVQIYSHHKMNVIFTLKAFGCKFIIKKKILDTCTFAEHSDLVLYAYNYGVSTLHANEQYFS